jgi:hypothetical protein
MIEPGDAASGFDFEAQSDRWRRQFIRAGAVLCPLVLLALLLVPIDGASWALGFLTGLSGFAAGAWLMQERGGKPQRS